MEEGSFLVFGDSEWGQLNFSQGSATNQLNKQGLRFSTCRVGRHKTASGTPHGWSFHIT